jgi:hypothetical protein
MADTLPDRLSVDPRSKFHDEKLLARGVGIRFNGAERTNVEEYCVSEGWIRTSVGKTLDRRGQPLTIKLKGKVEPYLKDAAVAAAPAAAVAESAAQGSASGEP